MSASSIYADVCDTESRIDLGLGRLDDAEHLAQIDGEIAEKVLRGAPGTCVR